jgi:hypothetical protein
MIGALQFLSESPSGREEDKMTSSRSAVPCLLGLLLAFSMGMHTASGTDCKPTLVATYPKLTSYNNKPPAAVKEGALAINGITSVGVVRFKLDDVAPAARVREATLKIVCVSDGVSSWTRKAGDVPIAVLRLIREPVKEGLRRGVHYTGGRWDYAQFALGMDMGYAWAYAKPKETMTLDVTDVVQGWVNDPNTNFGFVLENGGGVFDAYGAPHLNLGQSATQTAVFENPVLTVESDGLPVARIDKDVVRWSQVGQAVTLDGSSSPQAKTFHWDLVERPAPSSISTQALKTGGANVTFTPDVPGWYQLRLTVDGGDTAFSDVQAVGFRPHPRLFLGPSGPNSFEAASKRTEGNPFFKVSEAWANYGGPLNQQSMTAFFKKDKAQAEKMLQVWRPILKKEKFAYWGDECGVIEAAAAAYDWLYEYLTPQDRKDYLDYATRMIDKVRKEWWDVYSELENNRGQVALSLMMTCANIFSESEPAREAWDDVYYRTKYRVLPLWQIFADGGVIWESGYGTSRSIYQSLWCMEVLRNAAGEDLYPDFPFAKDILLFRIHMSYPGLKDAYSYGLYGSGPLRMRQLCSLPPAVARCSDATVARCFRDFVNRNPGTAGLQHGSTDFKWTLNRFFLWWDLTAPVKDYTTLPKVWHAKGAGWVASRTAWDETGTMATFFCGPWVGGHGTWEQGVWQADGRFSLYRKGHVVLDHYALNVPTLESDKKNGDGVIAGHFKGGYFAPKGKLLALQDTPDLTYAAGDITHSMTQFKRCTRYWIFLKPDYLVVADHMRADPGVVEKTDLVGDFKAEGSVVSGRTQGGVPAHVAVPLPSRVEIKTYPMPEFPYSKDVEWAKGPVTRVMLKDPAPAEDRWFVQVIALTEKKPDVKAASEPAGVTLDFAPYRVELPGDFGPGGAVTAADRKTPLVKQIDDWKAMHYKDILGD